VLRFKGFREDAKEKAKIIPNFLCFLSFNDKDPWMCAYYGKQ